MAKGRRTMTTTSTSVDTLEREVRAAHNTVRNGLSTRANHPTYGVTKASLFAGYHRLEGLVIAHRVVTDPDCPPNPGGHIAPYCARTFGFSLTALHTEIRSA
jgi:hypothetical protein